LHECHSCKNKGGTIITSKQTEKGEGNIPGTMQALSRGIPPEVLAKVPYSLCT